MIKSNDIFGYLPFWMHFFSGENLLQSRSVISPYPGTPGTPIHTSTSINPIQHNHPTIGTTTDSARALGTPLAVKLQKCCLKLPGIAIATTS